jgi:CRP-like cAMP-binding protein
MPTSPAPHSAQSPTLRALVEGEVLCREGDPPGPLYVIRSGCVRAYRRSATTPDQVDELARLGPGEIVGELSLLLQRARNATVEATEPTEVLEVQAVHLQSMLRQHQSLLRVLAVALKNRAGLSVPEVESMIMRYGGHLPTGLLSSGELEDPSPTIPAPVHDADVTYPKGLTCALCGAHFFALVVRVQKDQPSERSTDFHQLYQTEFNPYDYEVWVCPNDLFAALPSDFGELPEQHRPRVAEAVAAVLADWGGDRPDFNVDRNFRLRQQSLELALAQYRARNLAPLRMAAVLHRLAWCARERGDAAAERDRLTQALEAYSNAFNQFDDESAKTLLRVTYLCGELSGRLGDVRGAVQWFNEGLSHPQIKEHPHWDRVLRDRWSDVRARADVAALKD